MLSIIMLSIIMLSIIMLSIIMLSIIMPSIVIRSIIVLSIIMLSIIMLSISMLIVITMRDMGPCKVSYSIVSIAKATDCGWVIYCSSAVCVKPPPNFILTDLTLMSLCILDWLRN
jgi:hypothetical protein